MKKLLLSILILMIFLTACSAGGGTATEETADTASTEPADVPTTESLEPAPTDTPEPTAEPTATDVPTATATAEPEPTETAEPTPTEETRSPQEEGPSGNVGSIPEEIEFPEGAVMIFTRSGGFAGFDDTWVFYSDGRVTWNGEELSPQTPERINGVVTELDESGFFEMTYITGPNDFCCDFFTYSLAAQTPGKQNFVSFSEGDPNLPQTLWDALALMQELVNEASVR